MPENCKRAILNSATQSPEKSKSFLAREREKLERETRGDDESEEEEEEDYGKMVEALPVGAGVAEDCGISEGKEQLPAEGAAGDSGKEKGDANNNTK